MSWNQPQLTSPGGSSNRNPPEMCPHLLNSRDSTQESHNTSQEKVVNQKTTEMANCSSREKRPEEPATKTTAESSNRNLPEWCPPHPLSSREPSQMAYLIPKKEVHNEIDAQALRQTNNSDDIEKIREVPAVETTEQNGNSKAEANHGSFTSNQTEASPAVDNSTITCGDDTNSGSVKDTNNVSKSKETKEKTNRNFNDVVGHSPISSKQPEANAITSNPNEMGTITPNQTENDTIILKQTEANVITSNQDKADTITSKQIEADTIALMQTEANTIISTPTEEDSMNSKQIEADTIALMKTEANTIILTPTEEDSMNSKQTEAETLTSKIKTEADPIISTLTEEYSMTSKRTEADAVTSNPIQEDAMTSNQTEADTIISNPTQEVSIPSKQTETDAITSNPTKEHITTSKPNEEDALSSNQTVADITSPNPTESNALAEAADSPTRAFRGNILPYPYSIFSLDVPESISHRNPVEEDAMISKQTEADVITSNPTKSNASDSKQAKAADSPTRDFRGSILPHPLMNTNSVFRLEEPKICKSRKTSAVVGRQAIIASNQTEANPALSKPIRVFSDNTLPPPEALKNNTIKDSTPVGGDSTITSNQTEANSAVNYHTTRCIDDALPVPLKDTNDIFNFEAIKNKRIRNSRSVVGPGIFIFNPSEANSDVDIPRRAFRDETFLAPLRNTPNRFNFKEKTLKITIQNSLAVVGHRAAVANQIEADPVVDKPTTALDLTLSAPLKNTNNVSSFEAMKSKKDKDSMTAVGHSSITSIQTKVISVLNNQTTTSEDETLPAPLKDTTNISNSKTTEEKQIPNFIGVVGPCPITRSRAKTNSTSNNPTTCRDDAILAPVNYTIDLSNSSATKKLKTTTAVGHNAIMSSQTESDSALKIPTVAFRDDTLPAPLKDMDIVCNPEEITNENSKSTVGHNAIISNQSKAVFAVDDPTTSHRIDPQITLLSNPEAITNENITNAKSTVDHSAVISNQTKADSAMTNPTTIFREDSHIASLKDTNNVSNYEETKKNTINNSTSVIVYSTLTSKQTEADSASNKPATTCRDDSDGPPLNDTNSVSNSDMTSGEKSGDPTSAVGHGAITSNQTEGDSVVEKLTEAFMDNAHPASLKDPSNLSNSEALKNTNTNSESTSGHSAPTSNQTKGDSAVYNPTASCRENAHTASLKDTNHFSNSTETIKDKIKNSTSVIVYSAITSNRTEADSALNKQATTCVDNTLSRPLNDTNKLSDTGNSENIRNPTPVVGHGVISLNQTEVDSVVENPTCRDNTVPASLTDTNNVSNFQATEKRFSCSAITSNRTEADSASNKQETTCKDNTLSHPLNDTNKLSDSDTAYRDIIRNPKSVVGHGAVTSNQTEVDTVVENPTAVCRDNTLPASLTDTNNISNIQATKKRFTCSAITSNRTEADSTSNKQATTCKDNTRFPLLCDTNNISDSDTANREIIRNPTPVVGHGAVTSNQTEVDTVVENPTAACSDNTLPASLKDTNNITNLQATKKRTTFSAITSNQTEADSALNKQATTCKDNARFLPLCDTNKISDSDTENREIIRNPASVVGHGVATLNQTEVDSVVENPTAVCRDNTLPASLNKQATTCGDDTRSPPVNDTNKASDSDTANRKNIRNPTPVVGHGDMSLNQTKVDSVVENPTAVCRDNTLPASLTDTNNVSNIQATTKRFTYSAITSNRTEADSALNKQATTCKDNTRFLPLCDTNKISDSDTENRERIRNPTSVVGHGVATLNQTEVDSVVENPTAACRDNTLPASLKDTNNISNLQATKKIIKFIAITSNSTEADSASNKQATACKDNIFSPPLSDTNKVSDSGAANMEKNCNPTPVICPGDVTSNQTEVDSVVENPTADGRDKTLPAFLKDTKNFSNFQATKKRIAYRAFTSNQTKADSALKKQATTSKDNTHSLLLSDTNRPKTDSASNKQATTCKDDTLSPPLSDTNKVSDSDTANGETPAPVVGHGAMISNQTEVDSVVENPTGACRDKTLPASLKDTNNAPYFQLTKKRIAYSAFTLNRTKSDSALSKQATTCKDNTHSLLLSDKFQPKADSASNKQATTCKDNTLSPPLSDTNKVSDSDTANMEKIRNPTPVVGHGAITSNQTEVDSVVENPTAACRDNTHSASLKDTNNISSLQATKKRITYKAMTSNRTKADFALNKQTTCGDNTLSPSLSDANKVDSDTANRETPTPVVGHGAMTLNKTEVDSVVENPTAACRDNTLPASLKDTNNISNFRTTRKRKIQDSNGVMSPSPTTTSHTKTYPTSKNSTPTCRLDSLLAVLKSTINKVNAKAPKSSTTVTGHGTIMSNQTQSDSALNNPTTSCSDNALPAPSKGTDNVCKFETINKIKTFRSVVGQNPITSNQIKTDFAVDKLTESYRIFSPFVLLKDINKVSNYKDIIKNKIPNSESVVGHNAITSNQSKPKSAVDSPTTSGRVESHIALLKDTNEVSKDEETKKNKTESSNSVVGHNTRTSNQSKFGSTVDNPTTSHRTDSHIELLKDRNNVFNYEDRNNIKIKISKSEAGYSATTSIQNKVESAVDNPTTSCRVDSQIALSKDTNIVSNHEETKKNESKSSRSVVGHSAITSIQSKVESAVDNPTSRRVESQSALLKNTNNVFNYEETKNNKTKNAKSVVGYNTRTSNQSKIGSAVDNSTRSRRVGSRIALLKDTNNVSNYKATQKNKTKNSKSVVGHSTRTPNQSIGDSAVDTPTTSHRIDSHISFLKGTNVFNYEETTKNKIRISRPVVGHSAITSIQSKVGSPVNNSTTSCRVDSQVAVLKDTNNVSTHEETNKNKIEIPKPVVGQNTITSNQSKVDSAVNDPTISHRIESIIALFKDSNNVSSNEETKKNTIENSKPVVDHNAITSNQSQVNSVVDNPTTYRTDPHIALVKDTNKITNYKETKKNPKSVIIHSAITLNQTEADSAWNRPGNNCRDNTLSPPLNDINNVSNSDMTKGEEIRNLTSADHYGAITPNQTNVYPAVHDPTGSCRDTTLTASLKDPNNVPISKPTETKTMKLSESAVGQGAIMSNQTKVNSSLNDPTTCMHDSLPGPLKEANNVSNSESTKGKEMKNSTAVGDNRSIGSNKTETNANIDATTGVCSGGTSTAPMNGTNTISNSEDTRVTTQKNAKENHGPAQVGSSLNNPTKDCSDDPSANPVKDTDNCSKPKAPKVKKKRKKERKHKCPDCGKLFLFNAHLVVHYRTHTGERPFSCLECGKSFLCKTQLAAHQVFHSKERRYSCSECNKSFYNSTHLQVHRKIHKNERPYVCAECGKTFIHSSNYTKHLEIHKGVKNYLCSYCGKSFRQSSHLHSHQKQHTADHGFSCHKCHKKFKTERSLITHYKSHRITPLSCSECGKHFINRVSFDRHRRVHTGHKLLSCPECGKCFINKTHLSVHQRTHSGEKPFACTSCEMRFSDKSACKRHIGRHTQKTPEEHPANVQSLDKQKGPDVHTKPFQCLDCEKFYKTEARLSNHQKRHHKENPFSCSDCGKRFAEEALLAAHQKSHLAEKHFLCLQCGMGFKTQLELETHQEIHSIKALLCNICGRRFALEEHLAMHQKRHLDENLFSCEKCNIAFKSQAELETHCKSHPEKKFSCIDCERLFASEKRLAKHQRKHHGVITLLFSCVKCSRGFKTVLELETHERNHPELNLVFCPDCGRRFTSETLLAAHQKQHLGEKGFLCSRCSKGFKTEHDLKMHQKNHPEEKPFLCGDCGRRFASELLLSAHQERHVSKKRYLCMSCGRGFNEKSNFEKHCRVHTGERPYKCSDCDKTFSVKSNMIRHHKIHTGERPFKCLECGKSFRVKSYFLIHQKLHTGEREYCCPQCPKTFRDKSNYQRHKKSHTVVVKRFTCTECGKSFSSPTQLTIHARTHSRQKFECAHCGKNFKNNWSLNKHTKTHKPKMLSKAEKVAV
ncbi:uncharacterized protein LOC120910488 [Rana temporaria]|uniref:uncharacterized protein LOC120910488 n=1 Tax=Rana temporaria TaxID=8407 RepID=UPI001AAC5ED6|nr:uncharacterized protein LOC120910488 [Rana temporaria]